MRQVAHLEVAAETETDSLQPVHTWVIPGTRAAKRDRIGGWAKACPRRRRLAKPTLTYDVEVKMLAPTIAEREVIVRALVELLLE
jgi:hypothetical protein